MSHPDVQGTLQHLCDDAQRLTPFASHPGPQVRGGFKLETMLVLCSNKNHMVSFRKKKKFDIWLNSGTKTTWLVLVKRPGTCV